MHAVIESVILVTMFVTSSIAHVVLDLIVSCGFTGCGCFGEIERETVRVGLGGCYSCVFGGGGSVSSIPSPHHFHPSILPKTVRKENSLYK